MTTSDSEKENESTKGKKDKEKGKKEDRLEEIKKEEKEDASTYYAQGKEETPDMKKEFEEPVPEVDKNKEDMNLLRAVAFLGFGLAALAIIFILFFIRDLEQRMGGVDSAVNKLEGTIAPLKTELEGNAQSVKDVKESLDAVSATVAGLKGKLGNYEKSMAIMELKRALVMVQGISMGSGTGVQSKSSEVAASIQSLLSELGGDAPPTQEPAGEIQVQEAMEEPAPAAEEAVAEPEEAPAEEPAAEEAVEEESVEEAEDVAEESVGDEGEESSAEEEGAEESEETAEESSDDANGEEAGETAEEDIEESGEDDAEASAEESSGDDPAAEESGEKTADVEELPTVEELLQQ